MHRLVLLLAATSALGCHIDLNDPGTDPPVRQLYFPVGIAYDTVHRADGHDDRYLYVSNGNADLRYGGGTVQLVDIRRFDCAVGRFCDPGRSANQGVTPCARLADGVTPVLRMEASCDVALADQDLDSPADPLANPNIGNHPLCEFDPLDPSVVDCDETPFVVGNAVARVGNFAGAIRVYRKNDTTRRLFVSVRGDPSVTWLDVDLSGLVSGQEPQPGVIDCVDNLASLTSNAGYDPSQNRVVHAPGCDADHVIATYFCDGQHGGNEKSGCMQTDQNTPNTLPAEPFGMRLDQGFTNGGAYARLLVSHLSAGQVTLIDATLANLANPVLDVSPAFFQPDGSGRRGAFALAPQRPGAASSPWYMTSNLQPIISTFRVADVGGGLIVPSVSFNIGGAFAVGSDVRDIAFEPGGNRAFLTEANPPSLLVLDTRITSTRNPGQPINQLVEIVDVCQTPSHLGVRRTLVPGAPGTPDHVKTDAYVVCFLSNQVMVVDPDAPNVEDTVLMGRGPNDVAFNFENVDDAPPANLKSPLRETRPPSTSPVPRRGYVTHFSEMTIGEIDLEPGSPTKNRMVARLGKPVPPPRP